MKVGLRCKWGGGGGGLADFTSFFLNIPMRGDFWWKWGSDVNEGGGWGGEFADFISFF